MESCHTRHRERWPEVSPQLFNAAERWSDGESGDDGVRRANCGAIWWCAALEDSGLSRARGWLECLRRLGFQKP
ncbi:hypothetical protein EPI10_010608 [Gossypium australe]|uniref:Uncharacterized protein n=1 Tax=Gossypium australe TaxID=47621 RepID=A0A5B6W5Y4_9ROSI|nr:hypothetical protein EPI10_010608 [Gossypium australe]